MKIYISADMEGVAGIVHPDQRQIGNPEYTWARRLMAEEVNAAVRGALKAGAEEILVNDSHGNMRNLIPEHLHPEAQLITGNVKPWAMMEGIDGSFAAAFFIGYHARRGAKRGVLEHTYSERRIYELRLNGVPAGEIAINAALAGHYGVPVVLVSGDEEAVREAKACLGQVVGVKVKGGISRLSARSLHPEKAQGLIEEGAIQALGRLPDFRPFALAPPITLEVDFVDGMMADLAEMVPGIKRKGSRTVAFTAEDYPSVYKAFLTMMLVTNMFNEEESHA